MSLFCLPPGKAGSLVEPEVQAHHTAPQLVILILALKTQLNKPAPRESHFLSHLWNKICLAALWWRETFKVGRGALWLRSRGSAPPLIPLEEENSNMSSSDTGHLDHGSSIFISVGLEKFNRGPVGKEEN